MFGMDPQKQQMLGLMLAGGFGGMGGQPRSAGWSAPLGGFSRGLAQMMPYMIQMQQQQAEQTKQQQQQEEMARLGQQLAGTLPPGQMHDALGAMFTSKSPQAQQAAFGMLPKLMEAPEAPKTRDVRIGRELVTQEFVGGKWQEVGRGPAWAPPNSTTVNMPKPPPSLPERDQEVLVNGDPASPEYAMAYARTFLNPDFVAGTDAQGRPIQTPIYLPVPPNIRKPTYMGGQADAAQATQGAQQQAGGTAQGPAGPATGEPLVVGESTVRNSPELRKLEQGFSRVGQSVTRYRQNLRDYGEGPTLRVTDPEKASLLEQGYNDLMLEAKNLYDLGVLNGPDYAIMTTTLTPPTSAKAGLIGMKTFEKQLDAFEQKLRDAQASAKAIYAPSTAGQGQAATPGVPAVGTIDNGWRFKGGEPGLKENWEKVQ